MKRRRVYVDTSVVGGCLDEEFAEESLALLAMARRGEIILLVSDTLLDELADAPPDVGAVLDSVPPEHIEFLTRSDEVFGLRDRYLERGIVGPKSADDALHVAFATVARVDLFISWNFKHIVHYDKIRKFNGVNLVEGYPTIEIRSPKEVVEYEESEDI